MNRLRYVRAVAPLLALSLGAVACSSSSSKSSSSSSGSTAASTAAPAPKVTGTLNGSGSTFQASFDQAVIEAFKKEQPGVAVTYSGGGSGKGKTDLQSGVDQFAGTDSLVKDADKPKYTNGLLYWPIVAAPITVSYNLSGVDKLTLDAPTIVKIFQEEIKSWDDPAIVALNSGVKLPSTKITVVHRSDASGTTNNFSNYMKKAAPDVFTLTAGDTVNWPADEVAGNGNTGVASGIKQTSGAIGYVDFSDAKASGLSFASIKNKAGSVVAPSLDGTSAALSTVTLGSDLTYSPLNADGATSYPIATPTWIITAQKYSDANTLAALKAFLTYIYGPGQGLAAGVDFAKLPDSFVQQAKAQFSMLTAA
ncbi:MAG: phosphate ABC transporter substrate-binding protein PstS [Acidimicrobiales bacterium]